MISLTRSEAVARGRRGDRGLAEVARLIGVNQVRWIAAWSGRNDAIEEEKELAPHARDAAGGIDPEGKIERLEREIARLQRVNEQLEMDVEILGRAAAFAKRDE